MIEIIKRGTLPELRPFEGTCSYCKTEIRCQQSDGKLSSDQRDGVLLNLNCPTCTRTMWTYPKE